MIKDYIEREEAIEWVENIMDLIKYYHPYAKSRNVSIDDVIDKLEQVPAADVEPIVRCKDCKHRDPENKHCDSGGLERAGNIFPVSDDYFCAYGEKRS